MAEAAAIPPRHTSPLALRRWLGAELVRLRTDADLTQRDVANALRCSVGKVSYLESGDRAVSPQDLEGVLLDLYEVPDEERERYIEVAELASRPGWWDQWTDEDLPHAERRYVGLEDGATRIRAFHPTIIHGLVQTPEYTRGILRAFGTLVAGERVARLVDLRRKRQEALVRKVDPLQAHLVLDEAVVRRRVGSRNTMAAQLAHLADVAEHQDNILVQIVPFDAGAHGAHFGPFSILEFPWAGDFGLVFVEALGESRYIEARADTYRHSALFDRLVELALPTDESIMLLRSIDPT